MKNFIKYTSGVLFFLIVGIFFSGHSSALSGSEFNAGRIIDDAVFFNSNSMSVGEIQNFLNGKVACDTNGTKMNGGVTRAQYAASRGVPTTFTCLPQYRENISNHQNNIGNPSYSPPGSMTAAEIIYKVSADHGVSSKALIVLLQKEQALVTDEWPFPRQYQIATGYGCPDTAPCDDQYYGFYNQVNKAAYQFKRYVNNSSAYRYKAGQVNSVLWSPTTSCGASNVFIENGATAALYNYTPYRPNTAALNNLYGSGDGCSAYGNRNFWRYFRDWFGSVQYINLSGCDAPINTELTCIWKLQNVGTGEYVSTASTEERNSLLSSGNYTFDNLSFYAGKSNSKWPWAVPVHRFTKPNGGNFLTADIGEKNALVSAGFNYRGIDFYAYPPSMTSNAGSSVYRLYSPSKDLHAYATSFAERSKFMQLGYSYESVAWQSFSTKDQSPPPPAGKVNSYRFYIKTTNRHFYTTVLSEKEALLRSGSFSYEGVAWHGDASQTAGPAVYRLYSASLDRHLYTTSVGEVNYLKSVGWTTEGILHYSTTAAAGAPVYRVYDPAVRRHLWTKSLSERNYLVNSLGWSNEGVGWYESN